MSRAARKRHRWRGSLRPGGRARLALLCTGVALAAVFLADATGVVGALDANLRRIYYGVRGARDRDARVILVAIDEHTVDAWGPPPWGWDRYQTLIDRIEAGGPRLVAVLEPGPRVLPDAPVPGDLQARAAAGGNLVLPPVDPGFGQPQLVTSTHGVVEAVSLGSDRTLAGPSITRQLIERAGLPMPVGDTLAVNFAGPPDALPTLPAHRVATGEVPARTFHNRVVVIGLRGERFAPVVPTPVGPMSPVEVHAHALLGLATGAAWHPLPSWELALAGGLLALIFALALPRLGTRQAMSILTAEAVLIVIADYLLFAHAGVRAGAGAPLVGLVAGATTVWMVERRRAQLELAQLSRWLTGRLSRDAFGHLAAESDEEMWRRFATSARIYVDFDSTIVAPLPERAWHVQLAAFVDTRVEEINEPRRDVRRTPYKDAYLLHRPMWAERQFMKDTDIKSLIAPLVAFDRLLGIWVVNFPREREVSADELDRVRMLADQIAVASARRLLSRAAHMNRVDAAGRGTGYLVDRIDEMRRCALALVHEQAGLADLFAELPVGVLVATLWGEVQFVNEAMRRFLAAAELDEPRRIALPAILSRLTRTDAAAVRTTLREVVGAGTSIRAEGRLPSALGPATRFDMVLSRLGGGELETPDGAAPVASMSHFVLTISERPVVTLETADWGWSGARAPVDLREVVKTAVAELAGGAELPERALLVETPRQLTKVAMAGERVGDALRAVLRACVERGPADVPGRVVVREDDDAVEVRVLDPATVLTRSDVAAVTAGVHDQFAPDSIARHLSELSRAVEADGGSLSIDSDLDDGTTIVIRVRKE